VIATPGHTSADVCLVVQNTTKGTILVAGKFSYSHSLNMHVCVHMHRAMMY